MIPMISGTVDSRDRGLAKQTFRRSCRRRRTRLVRAWQGPGLSRTAQIQVRIYCHWLTLKVTRRMKLTSQCTETSSPARALKTSRMPNVLGYPDITAERKTVKAPASPTASILFSSYLPCWRDCDQKGGFLLSDLCIAHRGSLGGQVIFG